MSKRKSKHDELLKGLLTHVDLASLPEPLAQQAHEAIAEIGGCAFCGRAATRLCDFSLGGEIDPTHTAWPVFSHGEWYTCDAPLCAECCHVNGFTTASGFPEQVDWCPYHATCIEDARPMTKHEAERLRVLAWKTKLFVEAAQ